MGTDRRRRAGNHCMHAAADQPLLMLPPAALIHQHLPLLPSTVLPPALTRETDLSRSALR